MSNDLITGLKHCLRVKVNFIRIWRINHLFAFYAEHVIMQIRPQIIAIGTRYPYMADCAVVR